jgi:hypothetical protein
LLIVTNTLSDLVKSQLLDTVFILAVILSIAFATSYAYVTIPFTIEGQLDEQEVTANTEKAKNTSKNAQPALERLRSTLLPTGNAILEEEKPSPPKGSWSLL